MNDNLYGVQDIRSTSVDLSKGIVVCPLLSFYFLFLFFLLFCIFLVTLMALSISLIRPLWDLLIFSTLGSFPQFRGNILYITKSIEDFSHFTKYSNHKEDVTIMIYANVCLCQCSRICNDTTASCSNDYGKAQLACGSSIKQVACMT